VLKPPALPVDGSIMTEPVGATGDTADVTADRRGRPRPYVSYWTERRRSQRAAVFTARERGLTVRAIADETGLTVHEVESLLLSDRRSRRKP
jgi:hypothetical protein